MNTLRVIALLVYTCGAFAYGALVLMWLQDWWTGRPIESPDLPARRRELSVVGAALQLVSFVWFVLLVADTLLRFGTLGRIWQLELLLAWLAFSFPPLIMHISYAEVAAELETPLPAPWRALVWAMYIAMHGTFFWAVLASPMSSRCQPVWLRGPWPSPSAPVSSSRPFTRSCSSGANHGASRPRASCNRGAGTLSSSA